MQLELCLSSVLCNTSFPLPYLSSSRPQETTVYSIDHYQPLIISPVIISPVIISPVINSPVIISPVIMRSPIYISDKSQFTNQNLKPKPQTKTSNQNPNNTNNRHEPILRVGRCGDMGGVQERPTRPTQDTSDSKGRVFPMPGRWADHAGSW